MISDPKKLLRILIAVIAILSAVLGGGLLLPRSWEVERAITIAVPPAAVYAEVVSPKRWREWSVWDEREPIAADEFSGPEAGAGATRRWKQGDHRGMMKIMDAVRDRMVEYDLLLDGGVFALSGRIQLQPKGPGTRVAWHAVFRSGSHPIERYRALVIRFQIGRDLDASLARLKARLEKAP